jgi:antitoxin YefM
MAITASEARRNLFGLIEQVNDDAQAVEILSRKGTAFLVPEQEYRSLTELAHLVRSPANAARLFSSLEAARHGDVEAHDLDLDDGERSAS